MHPDDKSETRTGTIDAEPSAPVLDELLRARRERRKADLRCAFVYAHPDDESVGSSALLKVPRERLFLSATDGAPRNGADAASRGFVSWKEYAAQRRREWRHALALAGAEPERSRILGIADQEASFSLARLASALVRLFRRWRPDLVITHPYEGGHPDHDAVCFAVKAACRIVGSPEVVEAAFYHAGAEGMSSLHFLPGEHGEVTAELSPEERELKRGLFSCYPTQRETLRWFPVECERFRPSPRTDFTAPPHPGRLFYERYPWGMTGDCFRELAAAAAHALGTGVIL